MKEYEKIKLDKLNKVVDNLNNEGFSYPNEYKLNFPVLLFCRYCKKKAFTKRLSVFDGKIICNCKQCGGRHILSIKGLKEIKRTENFIKAMIAFFVLIIIAFL